MAIGPLLTPEQHEAFKRWGVLHLPGLPAADIVLRARERVFQRLAEIGVSEAGGWRLPDGYVGPMPSNGRILKEAMAELVGNSHPAIAALD